MNYYNYKYHEVLELEYNDYNFLVENMIRAKAKEKLSQLQLHVYPHTKKDNQDKTIYLLHFYELCLYINKDEIYFLYLSCCST